MLEKESKPLVIPVLAGLLVIAAFLIGNFWTRVRYFEKDQPPQVLAEKIEPGGQESDLEGKEVKQISPVTEEDHLFGNSEAEIILVEYSDFECPYSKSFHLTMKQVLAEYGDKVAWVYRHFPLDFHANAQKEAEASECAAELGGNQAFWSYADALFERTAGNGTGFALDQLTPLAVELGLDGDAFGECLDSGRFSQKVGDYMAGGQAAGIGGTPGTIVLAKDGERATDIIPGALPFESVKEIIVKWL